MKVLEAFKTSKVKAIYSSPPQFRGAIEPFGEAQPPSRPREPLRHPIPAHPLDRVEIKYEQLLEKYLRIAMITAQNESVAIQKFRYHLPTIVHVPYLILSRLTDPSRDVLNSDSPCFCRIQALVQITSINIIQHHVYYNAKTG